MGDALTAQGRSCAWVVRFRRGQLELLRRQSRLRDEMDWDC
jgi:hypothetical protein